MDALRSGITPSIVRMLASSGESQTLPYDERINRLRTQIAALKQRIDGMRSARQNDIDWESYGKDSVVKFSFGIRRQLKGHFGKVYDCDWGGDDTTCLSASQDGKLIVWNAFTENKREVISLASAWVMCCAFEKVSSAAVACGGLDNTCTVYNLKALNRGPAATLTGHDGYVADCAFSSASRVLTASGDGTCSSWDITTGARIATFAEHTSDVTSLSSHPLDPHIFASASCDSTVRVWDDRKPEGSVRAFTGHVSDVNSVDFLSSGVTVGTGSDDATCRVFDMRSCGPVNILADTRIVCGATDVAFSASGRILFAGYEEPFVVGWETIAKDGTYHELRGHRSRVSCLALNLSGEALLTGSWDRELAVWA